MNLLYDLIDIRDRDRYVQGDYRFRNGYCKHNPRKMVKTWAEKEMRNLMRFAFAHFSFFFSSSVGYAHN
jgi:serine/threonine-protein kinase RIO1